MVWRVVFGGRGAMAVALAVALASCQFDATAPVGELPPGIPDAGVEPEPSPDAGGVPVDPDPRPGCVDADRDGFFVPDDSEPDDREDPNDPNDPDARCGELDCNDENPDVFPGQVAAFTEADSVSGFDYDCDGDETRLVEHPVGGRCRIGFFSCEGTGWEVDEPACGQAGVWHRCESQFFSCVERERLTVLMPCN